jgi:intergrase/recombinase
MQSRFGKLEVSEARYEDLLSEADEHYPKYFELLAKYIAYVLILRELYFA